MIELNGYYRHKSQNNFTIQVLVQYDGRQLHVWHLSDPFYRVRTSKKFRICSSKNDAGKMIIFQDGASIETDDLDGLRLLNASVHTSTQATGCWTFLGRHATIYLTILILFLLSAICLSAFTM